MPARSTCLDTALVGCAVRFLSELELLLSSPASNSRQACVVMIMIKFDIKETKDLNA